MSTVLQSGHTSKDPNGFFKLSKHGHGENCPMPLNHKSNVTGKEQTMPAALRRFRAKMLEHNFFLSSVLCLSQLSLGSRLNPRNLGY